MTPSPSTIDALARGQACFNAHEFYDAHEAWEAAWRTEAGDDRRLLQGLIHVATGLYHGTVRGRPAGAVKLLASGLALLEPLDARAGGFALDPFRSALGPLLDEARRWEQGERGGLDVSAIPRLESLG
jgi:predicted metal-dependent hydrolase